jgi:O-antigen ligase
VDQRQLSKEFVSWKHKAFAPRPTFLVVLLACYVVIWYLQLGLRIPPLGAIRIEFLLAISLILFTLPFLGKLDQKQNVLVVPLVLFFVVVALQVPFSVTPAYSWEVFFNRVIKFSIMSYLIAIIVTSPYALRWLFIAFLFACAKMVQEGIVGVMTGGLVWENQGVMRLHGATPLYEHPNSFSGMALGCLVYCCAFLVIVKGWLRVGLLLLSAGCLVVILYTGSRTSYLGFVALIALIAMRSERRLLFSLFAIAFMVALLIAVPAEYFERFYSIFTLKEAEGESALTRIQILQDAWFIFLQHPFGVGVAAFPVVRMEYFDRFQDTHNLYLEVLTNLGIQGGLMFGYLIYRLLQQLSLTIRRFGRCIELATSNLSLQRYLAQLKFARAVAVATFNFVIIRLVLGLFGMDLYEIYWWFSVGLAIALTSIARGFEGMIQGSDKVTSSELSGGRKTARSDTGMPLYLNGRASHER